jgi:hypothetical protein
LQLLAGQRTGFRVALVIVEVRDRVPLMADRHRVAARPERLLAGHRPAVATISEVLAEQARVGLVAADRRRRQVLLSRQRQRPLIHMARAPLPRVLAARGRSAAPANRAASPRTSRPPGATAPRRRPTRGAPRPPDHPVPPSPPTQQQRPFEGGILHLAGSSCKRCSSSGMDDPIAGPIPETLSAGDLQVLARLLQLLRVRVAPGGMTARMTATSSLGAC